MQWLDEAIHEFIRALAQRPELRNVSSEHLLLQLTSSSAQLSSAQLHLRSTLLSSAARAKRARTSQRQRQHLIASAVFTKVNYFITTMCRFNFTISYPVKACTGEGKEGVSERLIK